MMMNQRPDISLPIEHWNLVPELAYAAIPWPWQGKGFQNLSSADVASLTSSTMSFLRYSPTDGPTDRVHTPLLPREIPFCNTEMAIYHDADYLYVFIAADRPATPIPELEDCSREDFSVVIASGCPGRGFYFGMNEMGEHIGLAQVWDPEFPYDKSNRTGVKSETVPDTLEWPSQMHSGQYNARVIAGMKGLTAGFQIHRKLAAFGMPHGSIRLSVGRTCYATGEWVSWGSPIIWTARDDAHGCVSLVEAMPPPQAATLARLDMVYDPATESAVFEVRWQGIDEQTLLPFTQGRSVDFGGKVTVALNMVEKTMPLRETTSADFTIPDGWNRLEVITSPHPVRTISFQKVSGHELQVSPAVARTGFPDIEELGEVFAQWHAAHEKNYSGKGLWIESAAYRPCLCHAGIFNIEPYILAKPCLAWVPAYEARIRETCVRMLEHQRPAGWFPCYCSALKSDNPELGDGGAFTNGSVGEGLVMAGKLLGESAWLEASRRAADYSWYRWENNQNYAAFALWHLAALYEIDPQKRWLDSALYLARNFVIRDIGMDGAQGGHNYFTGYGNITLKGLARLLRVLPENHEFRPLLKNKTIRFANQILSRQQPNGNFAGRNRKFIGYHHPVPGLFFVADALPDQANRIVSALAAMTRAVVRNPGNGSDSGLVLALAARAVAKNK